MSVVDLDSAVKNSTSVHTGVYPQARCLDLLTLRPIWLYNWSVLQSGFGVVGGKKWHQAFEGV